MRRYEHFAPAPRGPPRCSYLALHRFAEQPLGLEQDHDQEEHQRDAFFVCRREIRAGEVLEHADQYAAEQRAARLVEASDDRGIERLETDGVAHVELRE